MVQCYMQARRLAAPPLCFCLLAPEILTHFSYQSRAEPARRHLLRKLPMLATLVINARWRSSRPAMLFRIRTMPWENPSLFPVHRVVEPPWLAGLALGL